MEQLPFQNISLMGVLFLLMFLLFNTGKMAGFSLCTVEATPSTLGEMSILKVKVCSLSTTKTETFFLKPASSSLLSYFPAEGDYSCTHGGSTFTCKMLSDGLQFTFTPTVVCPEVYMATAEFHNPPAASSYNVYCVDNSNNQKSGSISITPGALTVTLTPDPAGKVGEESYLQVSFNPTHEITSSSKIILSPLELKDFTATDCTSVITSISGDLSSGVGCTYTSASTRITLSTPVATTLDSSGLINFQVARVKNPNTMAKQSLTIQTTDSSSNTIDSGSKNWGAANPATFLSGGEVTLTVGTICTADIYMFSMTLQSDLYLDSTYSYIMYLEFPSEIDASGAVNQDNSVFDIGSISPTQSLIVLESTSSFNNNGVDISSVTLIISDIVNPPSIEPTDNIIITIYRGSVSDSNVVYQEDSSGYSVTATAGTFETSSIEHTGTETEVSEASDYTFTFRPDTNLASTAEFTITIPSSMKTDGTSCSINGATSNCQYVSSNSIIAQNVMSTDFVHSDSSAQISFTVKLLNPYKTITTPSDFTVTAKISGYTTHTGTISVQTPTNPYTPGTFKSVSIVPYDPTNLATTDYTFTIQLKHFAKSSSKLRIVFPSDVTAPSTFSGSSISGMTSSISGTITASTTTYITLSNLFSADKAADDTFSFRIKNIKNKRELGESNSFEIYLYADNDIALLEEQQTTNLVAQTSIVQTYTVGITLSSEINGKANDYTFSLSSSHKFNDGETVSVTAPARVTNCDYTTLAPVTSQLTISGSSPSPTFSFTMDLTASVSTIDFTIECTNPLYTKDTDDFVVNVASAAGDQIFTGTKSIKTNQGSELSSVTLDNQNGEPLMKTKIDFVLNVNSVNFNTIWIVAPSTFKVDSSISSSAFVLEAGLSENSPSLSVVGRTIKCSGYVRSSSTVKFNIDGFTNTRFASDINTWNIYTKIQDDDGLWDVEESTTFQLSADCQYPCQACSGTPDYCTDCFVAADNEEETITEIYYDMTNHQCVASCPNKYFQDTNYLTCEECQSPCEECEGSATQCTKCLDPLKVLQGYTCTTDCDPGYWVDSTDNNICKECEESCETCSGSADNCLTCDTSNVNYRYFHSINNECLDQCPTKYYADSNYECQACSSSCATCENDANTCTSCEGTVAIPLYLLGTTCISDCSTSSTYPIGDSTLHKCVACSTNCATCSGSADHCLSCSGSLGLYNHECVECPEHTYIDANVCLTCNSNCLGCETDATTCISCDTTGTNKYLNEVTEKCVSYCPTGYYDIENSGYYACRKCNSKCQECDESSTKCTACDDTGTYPYFYEFSCLTTCPPGTLSDSSNECQDCNPNCKTCTGTVDTCDSCESGKVLDVDTCKDECETGYTDINQVCQLCDSNCKTCEGSITTCTSCVSSLFLYAGKCETECPTYYYTDDSNAATANVCLYCYDYLHNGDCIESCPEGTLGANHACTACDGNCKTCGGTITNCLSCYSSQVLYSGSCQAECPEKYLALNNVCYKCSNGCQDCITSTDYCTMCEDGYYFHEYACVGYCDPPLVGDTESMTCVEPTITDTSDTETTDTVEEPTTTEEDESFLPFPFLMGGCVLAFIAFAGQVKDSKSFFFSNTVMLLGFLLLILYGVQCFLALIDDADEAMIILFISGGALGLYVILNVCFLFAYKNIRKEPEYREWSNMYGCFTTTIPILGSVFTFQVYRLLYSRFFGFSVFHVPFADYQVIFGPLNCFSILGFICVYIPIMVADVYGFISIAWGGQFLITMIESFVLTLMVMLFEMQIFKTSKLPYEELFGQPKDVSALHAYGKLKFDDTSAFYERDKEKLQEKILRDICQHIGITSPYKMKENIEEKIAKKGVHGRCFSEEAEEDDKEPDPKESHSYPVTPRTLQKMELPPYYNQATDLDDFDNLCPPEQLPDNVYADSRPATAPSNKPKTEFSVQTPPFQKIADFKRYMRGRERKRKKFRSGPFMPDTSFDSSMDEDRELEVIKEEEEVDFGTKAMPPRSPDQNALIVMDSEESPMSNRLGKRYKHNTDLQMKQAPQTTLESQFDTSDVVDKTKAKTKGELKERKANDWQLKKNLAKAGAVGAGVAVGAAAAGAGKGKKDDGKKKAEEEKKKKDEEKKKKEEEKKKKEESKKKKEEEKVKGGKKTPVKQKSGKEDGKSPKPMTGTGPQLPGAVVLPTDTNDKVDDPNQSDDPNKKNDPHNKNGQTSDKEKSEVNVKGKGKSDIDMPEEEKKMENPPSDHPQKVSDKSQPPSDYSKRGKSPEASNKVVAPVPVPLGKDKDKGGKPNDKKQDDPNQTDAEKKNGGKAQDEFDKLFQIEDAQGDMSSAVMIQGKENQPKPNKNLEGQIKSPTTLKDFQKTPDVFDDDLDEFEFSMTHMADLKGKMQDSPEPTDKIISPIPQTAPHTANYRGRGKGTGKGKDGDDVEERKTESGEGPRPKKTETNTSLYTERMDETVNNQEQNKNIIDDSDIMGEFDVDDTDGTILILENDDGVLVDKTGRKVNKHGYLVDEDGNVINRKGEIVFRKEELGSDFGDSEVISPAPDDDVINKNGFFKPSEKHSKDRNRNNHIDNSLSKSMEDLMDQIEKEQTIQKNPDKDDLSRKSGSVDSLMEDTPSNYNIQNQRYEHNMLKNVLKPKVPKRKIKQTTDVEVQEPTEADMLMAKAYGGIPRGPQKKKPRKKKKTKTAKPSEREKLFMLADKVSGFNTDFENNPNRIPDKRLFSNKQANRVVSENEFARPEGSVGHASSRSYLEEDYEPTERRKKRRGKTAGVKPKRKKTRKDDKLEKIYGANMDDFLNQSDVDDNLSMASFAPSVMSRGTNLSRLDHSRVRGLETIYLQRLESSQKHNKKLVHRKNKLRQMQQRIAGGEDGFGNEQSERDEINSLIDENYHSMQNKYYGISPPKKKSHRNSEENINLFPGNRSKYLSPKENKEEEKSKWDL